MREGDHFWRGEVKLGFMDIRTFPGILAQCKMQGVGIDLDDVTYYLGAGTIVAAEEGKGLMPRWQEALFAAMGHNAARISDYLECRAIRWSRSVGRSRFRRRRRDGEGPEARAAGACGFVLRSPATLGRLSEPGQTGVERHGDRCVFRSWLEFTVRVCGAVDHSAGGKARGPHVASSQNLAGITVRGSFTGSRRGSRSDPGRSCPAASACGGTRGCGHELAGRLLVRYLLVGDLRQAMGDAVEARGFLSTASTTHHGASGICVRSSIVSLALV